MLLNMLLGEAGLDLKTTRLLRHQDPTATRGRTLFKLWRDQRAQFELYQSCQDTNRRAYLEPATDWVSFVVSPAGDTLLAGVYRSCYRGLLEKNTPKPHSDQIDVAGSCDVYDLSRRDEFVKYEGRLVVQWGGSTRGWIQRAHLQNKEIVELRRSASEEPPFPGYLNIIKSLSEIPTLPLSWIQTLSSSKGVYMLSCPRTREQYVGMAAGSSGFYGRWIDYTQSGGHGGNIGLIIREPSDYQVCILEVAGSAAMEPQIAEMETMWKRRLQSREMGLNRN